MHEDRWGGLERNTCLIMRAAATQLLPRISRGVGWPNVDRFVSIISSMVNLSFAVQILGREISLISPAYRLILLGSGAYSYSNNCGWGTQRESQVHTGGIWRGPW